MAKGYITKAYESVCDKLQELFCVIKFQDNNLCVLPFEKLDTKRKCERVVKKLKEKNNTIALSKTLEKNTLLKEALKQNKIEYLEGRKLFFYLSKEALDYICKQRKLDIQREEVAILIDQVTPEKVNLILQLAKQMKRINIISNHIQAFEKLENQLEELGIATTITNNRKKSLLKSKMILNLDFTTERLQEFSIYRNAIILNVENKVPISSKSFVGINVWDYEITGKIQTNESIAKDFSKKIQYEALLLDEMNKTMVYQAIGEEKIKIEYLIGKNGKIDLKEYTRI